MGSLPSTIAKYQKVGNRKINYSDDKYSKRYHPIDGPECYDSPICRTYPIGPINNNHTRLYYENAPINKLKYSSETPIIRGFTVTLYTMYPNKDRRRLE